MFENQVEQYIANALLEEAKSDGQFLNESELAFRVTGMMYQDKVKSDGPVSLRSVKGKMGRVRTICDENSKILLPLIEDVTNEDSGEITKEIKGWKIASPADLDYIGEVFLGIKPAKTDTADAPEAEAEAKK
jgi:hypothetical protein